MKKINFNKEWKFSLNDGEKQAIDLSHDFPLFKKGKVMLYRAHTEAF